MKCPKCGTRNIYVSDSRNSRTRKGWKRKRQCETCGYSFVTVERYSLTVEELSNARLSRKEEIRREKIARIEEMAQRLRIKLAEN